MKYQISSHNGAQKFSQTQVHHLLNDNLIICLRLWSGADIEQKVVEELMRFLSAADADLEVTTPYDYVESLSSLSNKVRVALLLAHEAIYSENKEKYLHGLEVALCYKHQKEISVATVGRFAVTIQKKEKSFNVFESGGFLDDHVLLPVALLGLEREVDIQCTSFSTRDLKSVVIASVYDDQTYWKLQLDQF